MQRRDTVYYARVYEAPAPAINAAGVSCEYDDDGNCVRANLCEGTGDCLAEHEPRAWSSPIWVDFDRPEGTEPAERASGMDRAALDMTLGGPFHPGCEFTWPMRQAIMWENPADKTGPSGGTLFRLKRRAGPEP